MTYKAAAALAQALNKSERNALRIFLTTPAGLAVLKMALGLPK